LAIWDTRRRSPVRKGNPFFRSPNEDFFLFSFFLFSFFLFFCIFFLFIFLPRFGGACLRGILLRFRYYAARGRSRAAQGPLSAAQGRSSRFLSLRKIAPNAASAA
jgi:hypothetical protein